MTPQAEWEIDGATVAGLLADQHPDLASLPLEAVETGWDNAMFRLGPDLAVRLPRRAVAAPLLLHEQRWLPHLAPQLSLPVPEPIRVGKPGRDYPCAWSIQPWLPGDAADRNTLSGAEASVLGRFLKGLHTPAPAEAPRNPLRGVPLSHRAEVVEKRMAALARTPGWDQESVRRIWDEAVAAPIDLAETWTHGDLHPRNVLANQGAITAIIDWGDLGVGDRATDLAAGWMLFSPLGDQRRFLDAVGPLSKATLQRALGWAVVFGLMFLETGLADHPRHAVLGSRILANVVTFWRETT